MYHALAWSVRPFFCPTSFLSLLLLLLLHVFLLLHSFIARRRWFSDFLCFFAFPAMLFFNSRSLLFGLLLLSSSARSLLSFILFLIAA